MASKVRVLEIISGFAVEGPLGGIERFGIELAKALDHNRVEPIVCGMWAYHTPTEYGWVEHLTDQGVDAFIAAEWDEASPYRSFMAAVRGSRQRLQGQTVDIIHSHCQFGDGLAILLQRQLQAKRLMRTVHNTKEWPKRPARRFWLTNVGWPLRFEPECGVAQQVVDNLDQRPLARLLGKRAILTHNALNLERFSHVSFDIKAKRQALNLPAEAIIIGTIGRLTEQKGITYLLQATKQLCQTGHNVHVLIIGTGDLAEKLHAEAGQLDINANVTFTGARSDVEQLLPLMQVFVNSSLWEGLPTVILESMAAGVPVVATDIPGNRDLIHHDHTGFLAPPADPAGLAHAISHTLSLAPSRRTAICAAAATYARSNFSIEQVAAQHNRIYLQEYSHSG